MTHIIRNLTIFSAGFVFGTGYAFVKFAKNSDKTVFRFDKFEVRIDKIEAE